jgi:hypothetical protein
LDGKESEDKNIDKDDYECISYENDVLNWLDECKKESVNIPILRETITQYINLIKTLTGQNINIKMSQDIAKRILKDKESFEAYQNLLDSEKEVRQQVLNEIFPDLIKSVKFNHKLESNDIAELFNENLKWRSVSFTNESLKMLGLSICFSFNFERSFYGILYGFRYETNGVYNEKLEIIKQKFDKEFDIVNSDNNWLCWNSLDKDKSNSNLETLKNIKFGNFKSDFEEKVKAMLSIIDSIKETKE